MSASDLWKQRLASGAGRAGAASPAVAEPRAATSTAAPKATWAASSTRGAGAATIKPTAASVTAAAAAPAPAPAPATVERAVATLPLEAAPALLPPPSPPVSDLCGLKGAPLSDAAIAGTLGADPDVPGSGAKRLPIGGAFTALAVVNAWEARPASRAASSGAAPVASPLADLVRRRWLEALEADAPMTVAFLGAAGAGKTTALRQCVEALRGEGLVPSSLWRAWSLSEGIVEAVTAVRPVSSDGAWLPATAHSKASRGVRVLFGANGRVAGFRHDVGHLDTTSVRVAATSILPGAPAVPTRRAFDVFYQLCRGPLDIRRRLQLPSAKFSTPSTPSAAAASSSAARAPGTDPTAFSSLAGTAAFPADGESLRQTLAGLAETAGESAVARFEAVLDALGAVLHLSNVEVKQGEDGALDIEDAPGSASGAALSAVAVLLGVSLPALRFALVDGTRTAAAEGCAATHYRDGLARALYSAAAGDAIALANELVAPASAAPLRSAALVLTEAPGYSAVATAAAAASSGDGSDAPLALPTLDVASLSDLHANHAAERTWEALVPQGLLGGAVGPEAGLPDAAPSLSLVSKRPLGLLALIEDAASTKGASDVELMSRLARALIAEPAFGLPPPRAGAAAAPNTLPPAFTVRHTFGLVPYSPCQAGAGFVADARALRDAPGAWAALKALVSGADAAAAPAAGLVARAASPLPASPLASLDAQLASLSAAAAAGTAAVVVCLRAGAPALTPLPPALAAAQGVSPSPALDAPGALYLQAKGAGLAALTATRRDAPVAALSFAAAATRYGLLRLIVPTARALDAAATAGNPEALVRALLAALLPPALASPPHLLASPSGIALSWRVFEFLEAHRARVFASAATTIQSAVRGSMTRSYLDSLAAQRKVLAEAVARRDSEAISCALTVLRGRAAGGRDVPLRDIAAAEAVRVSLAREEEVRAMARQLLAAPDGPDTVDWDDDAPGSVVVTLPGPDGDAAWHATIAEAEDCGLGGEPLILALKRKVSAAVTKADALRRMRRALKAADAEAIVDAFKLGSTVSDVFNTVFPPHVVEAANATVATLAQEDRRLGRLRVTITQGAADLSTLLEAASGPLHLKRDLTLLPIRASGGGSADGSSAAEEAYATAAGVAAAAASLLSASFIAAGSAVLGAPLVEADASDPFASELPASFYDPLAWSLWRERHAAAVKALRSRVRVHELEAAVQEALLHLNYRGLAPAVAAIAEMTTADGRTFMALGELVVRLRQALAPLQTLSSFLPGLPAETLSSSSSPALEPQWDAVASILGDIDACIATHKLTVAGGLAAEFAAVRCALANREAAGELYAALSVGRPRGGSAHRGLQLEVVSTATLDAAIEKAASLRGRLTEETSVLLRAARVVRAMRVVSKAGQWDLVARILADPTEAVAAAAQEAWVARQASARPVTGLLSSVPGPVSGAASKPLPPADRLANLRAALQPAALESLVPRIPAPPGGEGACYSSSAAAAFPGLLPPLVAGEVEAFAHEVDRIRTAALLVKAATSGRVGGTVGAVTAKECSVASLNDALAAAASAIAKPLECGGSGAVALGPVALPPSVLTLRDACASLLVPLRQAVLANDWSTVRSLTTALDLSSLPEEIRAEVTLCRAEGLEQVVAAACARGLATGKVAGVVGAIKEADISVTALDEALAVAERFGCATTPTWLSAWAARALRGIRAAAAAGDWVGAAAAAADLLRKHRGSLPAPPAGLVAPPTPSSAPATLEQLQPGTLAECELVVAEARHREVLARLRRALLAPGAVAAPGAEANGAGWSHDPGSVRKAGLEAVLAQLQVSPLEASLRTPDVLRAVVTLDVLVALREAVQRQDWAVLEALLRQLHVPLVDGSGACGWVKGWAVPVTSPAFLGAANAVAAWAGLPSPLVKDAVTAVAAAAPAGEALAATAVPTLPPAAALPRSPMEGDASAAAEALAGAVRLSELPPNALLLDPLATLELRAARCFVDDRAVGAALAEAVLRGRAVPSPAGGLDVTSLDVSALGAAVGTGAATTPLSPTTALLLAAASVLLDMRRGVVAADWDAVRGAVLRGQDLPPAAMELIAKEVEAIAAQLDDVTVVEALGRGLPRGGPRGSTGALDVAAIELDTLRHGLGVAAHLGCRTPIAKALESTARHLLALRQAAKGRDMERLRAALAAAAAAVMVPEVEAEVAAYAAESDNDLVVTRLLTGLRRGSPAGASPGAPLDTALVDVTDLEKGLDIAAEVGVTTPHAAGLLVTARFLLPLRLAVKAGQWEAVDVALGRVTRFAPWPGAAGEAAAAAGASTPVPPAGGMLSRWADKARAVARIESRVTAANLSGAAAASGGSPRKAAPEAASSTAPVVLVDLVAPEIAVLQREVTVRKAAATLAAAIAAGGIGGTPGAADLSGLSTVGLEEALAHAASLEPGLATADLRGLMESARFLLGLRSIVRARGWDALASALDAGFASPGSLLVDRGAASANPTWSTRIPERSTRLAAGEESGLLGSPTLRLTLPPPGSPAVAVTSDGGWVGTDMLVLAVPHPLVPEALPEYNLALSELHHRQAVRHLAAALIEGAIVRVDPRTGRLDRALGPHSYAARGGPVPATPAAAFYATGGASTATLALAAAGLDAGDGSSLPFDEGAGLLTNGDPGMLADAIAIAEKHDTHAPKSRHFLRVAHAFLSLRRAFLAGDVGSTEAYVRRIHADAVLDDAASVTLLALPSYVTEVLPPRFAAPLALVQILRKEVEGIIGELSADQAAAALARTLEATRGAGPLGALAFPQDAHASLVEAARRAEEDAPTTQTAFRQLLVASRYFAELRAAVERGDHGAAGSLLCDAGARALLAGNPVWEDEVERLAAETDHQRVVALFLTAMEAGCCLSQSGTVDADAADASAIEAAFADPVAATLDTAACAHLRLLAAHLQGVRAAVRARDWLTAARLAEAAADLPPSPPTLAFYQATTVAAAAAGADAYHAFPLLRTRQELAAVAREGLARTVDDRLLAALAAGGPAGQPGSLELAVVDTSGLDAAVHAAEASQFVTPHTASLIYSARLVRAVRAAAAEGNDHDLARLLTAVDFTATAGSSSTAAPATPSKRAGLAESLASPTPRPQVVVDTSVAGTQRRELRYSPLSSAAASQRAAASTAGAVPGASGAVDSSAPVPLHPAAMAELRVFLEDLHHRQAALKLRAGMAAGGPRLVPAAALSGLPSSAEDDAELDTACLDCSVLDRALALATARPLRTPEARRLVAAGRLLVSLRSYAAARDWETIVRLVAEARQADRDADRMSVASPLPSATVSGATASKLRSVRPGSPSRAPPPLPLWDPEAYVVDSSFLPPEMVPEVSAYLAEARKATCLALLSDALCRGGPAGPLGALDFTSPSTADLAVAVEAALALTPTSSAVVKLLTTAQYVLQLRGVLTASPSSPDWEALRSLLADAAPHLGTPSHILVHAPAGTLASMAARGVTPGAGGLLGAASTRSATTVTDASAPMLPAVIFSPPPAAALSATSTKRSGGGLSSSTPLLPLGLAEGARAEVRRVLDEVRERDAQVVLHATLHAAVADPHAAAGSGRQTESVATLAAAIDAAEALGCNTDVSTRLLAAAKHLKALRTAHALGDPFTVQQAIEGLHAVSEVLPAHVLEEMEALGTSHASSLEVARLLAALPSGAASGEVGTFPLAPPGLSRAVAHPSGVTPAPLGAAVDAAASVFPQTPVLSRLLEVTRAAVGVRSAVAAYDTAGLETALAGLEAVLPAAFQEGLEMPGGPAKAGRASADAASLRAVMEEAAAVLRPEARLLASALRLHAAEELVAGLLHERCVGCGPEGVYVGAKGSSAHARLPPPPAPAELPAFTNEGLVLPLAGIGSVGDLEAAMATAENAVPMEARSKRLQELLWAARAIVTARRAASERQWRLVAQVTGAWTRVSPLLAVLDNRVDAAGSAVSASGGLETLEALVARLTGSPASVRSGPVPAGMDLSSDARLHAGAAEEFRLWRLEVEEQLAWGGLLVAAATGVVRGSVGAVATSYVAPHFTESVLASVRSLGCKSATTLALYEGVSVLATLRASALDGRWSDVLNALDAGIAGEAAAVATAAAGGEASLPGSRRGSVASTPAAPGGASGLLASLLMTAGPAPRWGAAFSPAATPVPRWRSLLARFVASPGAAADGGAKLASLPPASHAEVCLLTAEAVTLATAAELDVALGRGAAAGEAGKLDVTTVATEELDTALSRARDVASAIGAGFLDPIAVEGPSGAALRPGALSPGARRLGDLVDVGTLVLSLRRAVAGHEWELVSRVMASVPSKLPEAAPGAVATELALLRRELAHRGVLQGPLLAAMTRGGLSCAAGSPPIGGYRAEDIDTSELEAAIARTEAAGRPASEAAERMLSDAKALLRFRRLAKAGRWADVRAAIAEWERGSAAASNTLVAAVTTPAGAGVGIGSLLLSTTGVGTPFSRSLAAPAAVLAIIPDIRDEARRMVWEAENVDAAEALTAALKEGSGVAVAPAASLATSLLGSAGLPALAHFDAAAAPTTRYLDRTRVVFFHLDAPIERARALARAAGDAPHLVSPTVNLLLETAVLVRTLRAAVVADDVTAVLAALDAAKAASLADVAQEEVATLLRDMDERTLTKALVDGLGQGRVRGRPGALELGGVSTEGLDAAIKLAGAMGCRTARSQQLLKSAQCLRRLRLAVARAPTVAPGYGALSSSIYTAAPPSAAAAVAGLLTELVTILKDVTVAGEAPGAAPVLQVAPEALDEVVLVRDDAELTAVTLQLQHICRKGAVAAVPGRPWELDTSAVSIGHMDPVLARARAVIDALGGPTSGAVPPGALFLVRIGGLLRDMRAAVLRGGAPAEAAALATTVRDLLLAGPGVYDAGSSSSSAPSSPAETCEEAEAVLAACGVRSRQLDALSRLQTAIGTSDLEALSELLPAARAELHVEALDSGAAIVRRAEACVAEWKRAREGLRGAAGSANLEALERALGEAARAGYAGPEVAVVRAEFEGLTGVIKEAADAVAAIDTDRIRAALASAAEAGIVLPSEPAMRKILALPLAQLHHLQLRAAVERNDPDAVARLTIVIKGNFFNGAGTAEAFALKNLPALRSRSEWFAACRAAGMGGRSGGGAQAGLPMLGPSTDPIPTSLTVLPGDLIGPAVALNRSLLVLLYGSTRGGISYDGVFSPALVTLAHQLVQVGLAQPGLRDELLVQIARAMAAPALAREPKAFTRAASLLLACLCVFPPSDALENYLECFLRCEVGPELLAAAEGEAADALPKLMGAGALAGNAYLQAVLTAFHRTAFVGARQFAPTTKEVEGWLSSGVEALRASVPPDEGESASEGEEEEEEEEGEGFEGSGEGGNEYDDYDDGEEEGEEEEEEEE